MTTKNAYRVTLSSGWGDINEWWYGSNNPLATCGYHILDDGNYLVMVDVSDLTESHLESAPWCESWAPCRVDSPQVGDTEPDGDHETIDGAEQLLWVS